MLFKTLIFHLESPAGIVFPSVRLSLSSDCPAYLSILVGLTSSCGSVGGGCQVTAPEPMRCHSSTYYHAFRRHVLQVRSGPYPLTTDP